MKNYSLILLCMVLNYNMLTAQIKVTNNGRVGIGMNTPYESLTVLGTIALDSYSLPWGYSFYTKIHNQLACSYHLNYNSNDVFFVCGQGWLWAQSGGYFGSDSTLKKDISNIINASEKINKLQGVSFRYKSESPDDANPIRFGFIAQDVNKTLPNLIKTQPNGLMGLTYTDIIPLLVEGFKEQQSQIIELQNKINLQQIEIENLKKP